MAVNPAYLVAALDLSEVFLDKDTGAPLSGGRVYFFRDQDRVTPKLVYTIQNNNPLLTPPNYSYVPLPDFITLSATGQFQDNVGNNIPVYYYPVIGAQNTLDLYYIVVTNANGVQQFTRQAWPPNESTIQPAPGGNTSGISNQITNSQFLDVNFSLANVLIGTTVGFTYNYAGAATDTINIAPGWNLVINHTGNGQIQIGRTPVQGSSAFPYDPPYTLYINPGVNIAQLSLVQTFQNNPDVFSPALGATNGWLSGSFLLAPGSSATMSYRPNGQPAQQILNRNNATGNYVQYDNTIQLQPATNPSTGDTGSVDIVIDLPIAVATTLSNIQVVPLNSNIPGIAFDQRASSRERDFEFNYWNPLLQYKPIKSYLVGWDFPMNPTQFLGPTVAASAAGANNVQYVWDQTLVFSTANNGAATSRSAAGNGALRITATNATQFALIQYLPQSVAREILNDNISSMVTALTSQVGGLVGTISLWYTNNVGLPSAGANNTFFTGLDANGFPTGIIAGWTQVPRGNLGNAQFTVGNSANTNFNNYGFSGWNDLGVAGVNTATFFAIVVGFATLNAAGTIDFKSISLVPGKIPTIPGYQSKQEVNSDCFFYYQKSFLPGTVPAQNVGFQTGEYSFPATIAGALGMFSNAFPLQTQMISNTQTFTTYSPLAASAEVWDRTIGATCTGTGFQLQSNNMFSILCTGNAGGGVGDLMLFHWTADARLGV